MSEKVSKVLSIYSLLGGNTYLAPTESVYVVHAVPEVNLEYSNNQIDEVSQSGEKDIPN